MLALLVILAALPPPPMGRLAGTVTRRGVAGPLAGAVIDLNPGEHEAFCDAEGRFSIDLRAGRYRATIRDVAVRPFAAEVQVEAGALTEVRWALTPVIGVGADVVVVGRRPRAERRTALDNYELTHVAGTMGDPLRVVQSLPGVGTFMSLLPYPVIRGAPPGDAAWQLDGTPVPLLFHLGVANSVVHPGLVERVDFYPGVAPTRYGRYVGGVVDGVTRKPPGDRWAGDLEVNLFQSAGLITVPLAEGETRLTMAGRYSYTGLIAETFAEDLVLDFWDYHLRLDQALPDDARLRVSAFGASDDFGTTAGEVTAISFHRLVGDYAAPIGAADLLRVRLDLGIESVDAPDEGAGVEDARVNIGEWLLRPKVQWEHALAPGARLVAGADLELRRSDDRFAETDAEAEAFVKSGARTRWVTGAYSEVAWRLDDAVTLLPGLRLDLYRRDGTRWGLDPRLGARWRLSADTVLVGQVGVSHAPQRFFVPIPGVGDVEVDADLIRAWQVAVGVERALGERWSLDVTVYGSWLQNLLSFDDDGDLEVDDEQIAINALTFDTEGRGAGLELMLRRRRTGRWFGWLAYTLQRAERRAPGGGWGPSALDQTHVFNAVATWQFAGLWAVGVRGHYHSGRFAGLERSRRLPGFFQVDLRLDKSWIHDDWLLELYVDVINASYQEEVLDVDAETGARDTLRYVLPTLGARARF